MRPRGSWRISSVGTEPRGSRRGRPDPEHDYGYATGRRGRFSDAATATEEQPRLCQGAANWQNLGLVHDLGGRPGPCQGCRAASKAGEPAGAVAVRLIDREPRD